MRVVPQTECGHHTAATKVQACCPRLSMHASKSIWTKIVTRPINASKDLRARRHACYLDQVSAQLPGVSELQPLGASYAPQSAR